MNSIFFAIRNIFQDYFQLILPLVLATNTGYAEISKVKSPVRVRDFKYYRQIVMGNKELLIDKKNKTLVYFDGSETLKISKSKNYEIFTFSRSEKKMFKNVYFKKSKVGRKSLLGLISQPKSKMYFTDDQVKCFDRTSELLDFLKKEDFGDVIENIQFDKFLDIASCKSISPENMEQMKIYLKEKFSTLNGNILKCMRNEKVQKILDSDYGLRENMILFVGRFLGIVNSFKDTPPIKIACSVNNDKLKYASLDTVSQPPTLALFYNGDSFNVKGKEIENVLNHEIFHYGISQLQVGEATCMDESYAKVITNLCSPIANFTTMRTPSSTEILTECKVGIKKNPGKKEGYLALQVTKLEGDEIVEISSAQFNKIIELRPIENRAEAVIVASQITPQNFRTITDGDIDRVLTSIPVSAKEGEQVSVPASVFGGSIERIFEAGEATMADVGKAVTATLNTATTAAVGKVVGDSGAASATSNSGRGTLGSTNSEISVYPLASIVSDVYSTSPDKPSLVIQDAPAPKVKQVTTLASKAVPANDEAGADGRDPASISKTTNGPSTIDTKPKVAQVDVATASAASSGASAANAPTAKNLKTGNGTAVAARTIASTGPATLISDKTDAPPVEGALVKSAVTAVSPSLNKARVDNEFLQGLSVYRVITGSTYDKYKEYYKKSDADLVNRGIFIYDKNNKPLGGVLTNAKICFRDITDTKELKKENCPTLKKR